MPTAQVGHRFFCSRAACSAVSRARRDLLRQRRACAVDGIFARRSRHQFPHRTRSHLWKSRLELAQLVRCSCWVSGELSFRCDRRCPTLHPGWFESTIAIVSTMRAGVMDALAMRSVVMTPIVVMMALTY